MAHCTACHAELVRRLGTERDSDLAKVFELTRERIRQLRRLHHRPRFGTIPPDIAEALLERLRTSDAPLTQIAAGAGVSYGRLRRLACAHGVDLRARQLASYPREQWADRLVTLYASGASARVIGEAMGISAGLAMKRILRLRQLRGTDVLPYRRVPSGDTSLCRRCRGPKVDTKWTVLCPTCRGALHDILGAPRPEGASFAVLSREFGIIYEVIRNLAHRLPAGPGWLRTRASGVSSKPLDTEGEVAYTGGDAVVFPG